MKGKGCRRHAIPSEKAEALVTWSVGASYFDIDLPESLSCLLMRWRRLGVLFRRLVRLKGVCFEIVWLMLSL